jgi:hypothetical protein
MRKGLPFVTEQSTVQTAPVHPPSGRDPKPKLFINPPEDVMLTLAPAARFPVLLVLACIFLGTIAVGQTASASPKKTPANSRSASQQSEIDDLKSDMSQMKVVLNQMTTNLAAVSDSQSPLKHQFQLDIEMWQIVIMQTQRRINALEQDRQNDAR